jgi:hypothetical protein
MDKNSKISKSMEGNKNAEKWTLKEAQKLFNSALELSKETENRLIKDNVLTCFKYHFLGEIAAALDQYGELFTILRHKYPTLETDYKRLKQILESNCFSDSKKGLIKEASAIMNLKSNYGWTDRVDNTTKGEEIKGNIINLGGGEDPDKR